MVIYGFTIFGVNRFLGLILVVAMAGMISLFYYHRNYTHAKSVFVKQNLASKEHALSKQNIALKEHALAKQNFTPKDNTLPEQNQVPASQALSEIVFNSTVQPMMRHVESIVPNIIHFIKFRSTELSFTEMVCILSAHVNHRPEAIWIHCSLCVNGTTMSGKYWEALMARNPPVEVHHVVEPTHVFGRKLSSTYHASDIARMLILMEHGGIYLDNDVFVINSLDQFLHYEMSLGWPENKYLGNQVLVAHRNARFLRLWYDSYRFYNGSRWYYNAGELPTTSVLVPKPYLVHRVFNVFGVHMLVNKLYKSIWPEWQDYFSMHLLMSHRYYLDKDSPIKEFNETNIKTYNRTFGQMARLVLFNTIDFV